MTKRGGDNSLITCPLYYFSTKWEMTHLFLMEKLFSSLERNNGISSFYELFRLILSRVNGIKWDE